MIYLNAFQPQKVWKDSITIGSASSLLLSYSFDAVSLHIHDK